MIRKIEYTLYIDPQTVKEGRCGRCGSAVYPPSWHCIRCERDGL